MSGKKKNCRKKARYEGKDGKRVASLTPGAGSTEQIPALHAASLTPAASSTEKATYTRSDLAAAAAQLAQLAFEARRSSARRPVFEIYSVTERVPTPRYDWPDTDDEMTICALT